MKTEIDYTQIKVLEDFFSKLSHIDQRKIFLAGFRKAGKPLVKAAKANTPIKTGKLQKSIGTMAIPREIAILVGAKKPKGSHGHLIESGTTERFRKSGGSTGKVKATNFFEQAYDSTSKEVFDTIEKEWYMAIDRFIISTNKKL